MTTLPRKRVDGNHRDIQRAVESVGASWLSLASVGRGAPDALVGWHGQNYLWEIKNPATARGRREAKTLPSLERAFHDTWRGEVEIIESAADALAALGVRPRAQRKDDGS